MGQTSDNVYTSQSISGYNSSPPPDDASVQSSNKLEWAKHKTKLADPVKTLAEAVNTAMVAAGTNLINTATGVRNQVSGSLGFAWATVTIGVDVITPDATHIVVGAEAGATSDTLQAIRTSSVYDGARLTLRALAATEEIVLTHATSTAATATDPNIYLSNNADVTLANTEDTFEFIYDTQTASGWIETSRSLNAVPALTATDLPVGSVIQVVSTRTATVNSGSTAMPSDDSIPGITEGDEFMTLAIAPTEVGNTLIIETMALMSESAVNVSAAALFQDSATDALTAISYPTSATDEMLPVSLPYVHTASATSSTTFRFRAGNSLGGTTTINGQSGNRRLGGVAPSTMIIREYKA